MVRKKQKKRKISQIEEDPLAGTTNLVDAMLVIAVGFLIFVVMSWNMQDIVFSDISPDEKQDIMQSIQSASEVEQGQQLNNTPDSSNNSGQGYTEMGKVYKDPNTGKLIMVET